MTERKRLTELIMNTPKIPVMMNGRAQGRTYQTARNIADHLLANGVMCIDTNTVDVVKNREPLITAFGMPLNELVDLIRAKREGRLIVPPCKVGSRQKVYIPIRGTTVVYETKVYGIGIDEDGDMVINPKEYPEDVISMNCVNVGKTVFLTREEAEKALEERSGKDAGGKDT